MASCFLRINTPLGCFKIICAALALQITLPTRGPAQCPWTQKSSFGGVARANAVGFSIGTKGYIGTGNDGAVVKQDFWEWDGDTLSPSYDTWTQKADFGGGAIAGVVGFSIGTKGYIGTGFDGTITLRRDFWEWEGDTLSPAYNTWTKKADFGGLGRTAAVGFSIGAKGYIGTGFNGFSKFKDFWEWDGDTLSPAYNTWTKKADFGGDGRSEAVGFFIGTKGYIGIGWDINNDIRQDFWEWDGDTLSPAYNTWTKKTDFGGGLRDDAIGFSIGTKGYIGTGEDGSAKYGDFWEWNGDTLAPAYNTWTKKADFGGSARQFAVGFSIGTKGYIGTGDDGTYKNDFWEYDPLKDLSISITKTNITCIGDSDGTATAMVTGYSSPYTYLWSNGQTNSVATGLSPGNFTVSVTNVYGCTFTDTVAINSVAVDTVSICLVTVDSNTSTKNIVVWEKPVTGVIDSFRVYRDIVGIDTHIGSVPYLDLSEFVDSTQGVNPIFTSYRYRISIIDTCGNESVKSDYHETMNLQISQALPQGSALDWNDYIGFSVSYYRMLRDSNNSGNWQAFDSTSFGITQRTDTSILPNARYMIEVVHPSSCTAGKTKNYNSSKSNTSSVSTGLLEKQSTTDFVQVYPNPSRGVFTLQMHFPEKQTVKFRIYNIQGQLLQQRQLGNVSGRVQTPLNLSGYDGGFYYLQIITDRGVVTSKLVVE